MIKRHLFEVVGILWMWTEIGTFLRERIPESIGNNPLYWVLWSLIIVVAILIAHILDQTTGTS